MTPSKLTNLQLEQLTRTIPDALDVTYSSKGEATFVVDPRVIADVMEFLRDHRLTRYKVLVDMSGTDYPSRENRFDVVYSLLSIAFNARLRVKTLVADGQPIESVRGLFSAAL
jgi:NADH:ubiquinone oxidoreductase subunit C